MLDDSMTSPPRSRRFFRPILTDIRRTAAAWRQRIPFAWIRQLSPQTLNRLVILQAVLVLLACAVFVATAMYVDANTGVRREATTTATWTMRHEGGIPIAYLRFPHYPQFGEEAVTSDRLVKYLKTKAPNTLRATMIIVYDFDEVRSKGPTLTADGITLDE